MVGDNTREERLKALKRYRHKKIYRQGNLDKHVALHERGFDCYQCDDGDAPQPHPSSAALTEHVSRFHPSDITGRGAEPSTVSDPEREIVKTDETNSKRFRKNSYDVELRHVEHVEPSFENFDTLFSCLLEQAAIPHTCVHAPYATPL